MARSIQEMREKFKHILMDDVIFYGALLVLVAGASFGLGRLSGQTPAPASMQKAPISVSMDAPSEYREQKVYEAVPEEVSGYVASKNGTKYHLSWCPGASQIKEENKIYFASKEAAEEAGYTPASNCKGM